MSNAKEMLKAYAKEISEGIMKTDFDSMAKIIDVLLDAKERKATIFTAGNGGSAATASHICNDLLKGCNVCNKNGFITECLADSTAVLTCLANDFDYESVFSIQLETKANKEDILIVYSGSGNSANILKAVKFANENEMTVIGFTGRDGGKLAPMCDITVIAPTDSMEQIEDYHMMYVHSLSDTLQKFLKEKYQ